MQALLSSRRAIGEHVGHPLVGWRTSGQDSWGLRSNLIGRGIFEDFHAGSQGNLYSKIATPRAHRYESGSLIITSNQPFSHWDQIFPDTMMTVAAIDQLNQKETVIEKTEP